MYPRLNKPGTDHSFFLFGLRGSGKSTLLKEYFSREAKLWINLLNSEDEHTLQTRPNELLARTKSLRPGDLVVIDEVQKAPQLLDLVHELIETKKLVFALSGSSARKLKRGAANLLAGRAFVFHLFPLCLFELQEDFNLDHALTWGTLPKVLSFSEDLDKKRFLRAYANTYLKEEIAAEQLTRNVPQFRKFLDIAGQMNGKPLNYSSIARDVGTDHSVISTYYDILEDTLVGFRLPSYHKSIRKQQRQHAKFYFVDLGIKRSLSHQLEVTVHPSTSEYGFHFESFIISEIFKLCSYREKDERLFYLQTKDGAELDLIIDRPGKSTLLVEIKSKTSVHPQDTRTLESFSGDFKKAECFLISQDPHEKQYGAVTCLPWEKFLRKHLNSKIN